MKTNQNDLVKDVFEIFLKYGKGEIATDYEYHKKVLSDFITNNRTIKVLIPAFPGKSINNHSVLGASPDFGEAEALDTLSNLCNEVGMVYKHGCEVYLFHDGHYFFKTGCIRCYEELDYYIEELKKHKKSLNIKHIKINDIFKGYNYDEMVAEFINKYCPELAVLKEVVLTDECLKKKYVNEYIFV